MSAPAESRRRICVSVGGIDLQLSVDADESAAVSVAAYVNRVFNDMEGTGNKGDSAKQAILVAMNIAGELFECRERLRQLETRFEDLKVLSSRISVRIDAAV